MKAVRTSSARRRVRCRLPHPLARSSFYRQLAETARNEDAPLAVAQRISASGFRSKLMPVSSGVHQSAGLGYSLGGGRRPANRHDGD
jgi:hypothetical protein